MIPLLGIHSLSKSYGTITLFQEISFTVSEGDRIGLVGPNGAGKSTFLKIVMGIEKEDQGSISRRQGLRIGYASQIPHFPDKTLEEILLEAIPSKDSTEQLTRARILLSKAQFTDFSQKATVLSGGWKKRLDIARALMQEPDLLLLDEPTNHLDLEGILWLEKFLERENISYLVISHDRYFLENVTNKIIEFNKCYPQGLFISEGNMSAYIEHKEAFLQGQRQQERSLANSVREEIEWLRKSPKARTTKSQSRVQKAYSLMEELSEIKQRNKVQTVAIDFTASERETRKLIVAHHLSKSLGGKQLFKGIDVILSPGTRLGVVGKNGTGKTTLLKMLAGQMIPDTGTIKYADDLKIVYFDQHREHISPDISLRKALAPTNDRVNYRGQSIHVNGWAQKFLFSPDRLEMPVGFLSGGERARIMIAKLMLEPADVLFLDEPTNDLDIPTLEVIEECLLEYTGAVVLITHDRCLMDRVCTKILGLGEGLEACYYADYSQWESASAALVKQTVSVAKQTVKKEATSSSKKLSYMEQKELEGMEQKIAEAESCVELLQKKLEVPEIQNDAKKTLEAYQALADAQSKLDVLFDRWQHLLNKQM
jgi:ATP-binding cassette subfamily F protein uup